MNAAVEDELIDTNPVKVKAAAHAQVARERDPAPLPIPILFRVADAMPERLRLGVLLGGVLGMRSGEVRALQRRDFTLSQDMPTVTVSRAVKEAEGKLEIGTLKTARKGIASRTPVIPAALVDAVRDDRRDHTQIGRNGLLFWRAADGRPIPLRRLAHDVQESLPAGRRRPRSRGRQHRPARDRGVAAHP